MKNIKIFTPIALIAIYILSCFYSLKAQDIKADFRRANLAVAQEKELSFDITYNFYCSSAQTTPTESEKGRYAKKGDAYYSVSYGIETISSENLLLMVNSKDKTILISPKKNVLPYSELNESIEKTLKYCKKTDCTEEKNEKIYTLIVKNFGIDKIEIRLRKPDLFLTKVVFFQSETVATMNKGKSTNCKNPKTEVLFSNIIKKSTVGTEKLALKNYIVKQKNGSFKAVGVFKNFKLVDLRKNEKTH